jgi:hypothetical protein
VPTTLLTKLSPVSTTPVINLCHGFSVINGVVDTGNNYRQPQRHGDEYIDGINDTSDKFIASNNEQYQTLSHLNFIPLIIIPGS